MWRKGSPLSVLVGMQIGEATVENSIELPQKIKMGTAYDPAVLLLILKKAETLVGKNISTPVFIATLFR